MPRLLALLGLALALATAGSLSVRPRSLRAQPEDFPFTLTWQRLSPAVSPPARSGASMAYDGATGTLLLFGGNDGVRSLGDTWRWDGRTWTELHPATSPPARESSAMAYHPDSGRIVLFGGQVNDANGRTYLGDTWAWDGETWSEVTPVTGPAARSGAGLAYDGVGQTLLLFGGADIQPLGDTWTLDGSAWTRRDPPAGPPARFGAAMIWHSPTGIVLLFGGNGACDPNPCADTWAWYGGAGGEWGRLERPVSPPGRYGAGLALKGGPAEQGAGMTALFGGFAILGPRPGSTVLGGTQTFGDTWIWNGEGWLEAALTPSPRARAFATMAPNDADGSIVLFGGSGVQGAETVLLDDTWILTGTPRANAPGPPPQQPSARAPAFVSGVQHAPCPPAIDEVAWSAEGVRLVVAVPSRSRLAQSGICGTL